MTNRSIRVILGVMALLATGLSVFFIWAALGIVRETDNQTVAIFPNFPVGKELSALLPIGIEGGVTQGFVDFDGDGAKELVIGYGIRRDQGLTGDRLWPHIRAFRKSGNVWQSLDEFDFPVTADQFANAADWQNLAGTPSFEHKDINGDNREELFIRLAIGSEFFHAVPLVVWNGAQLTWMSVVGRDGRPLAPIFLEGGSTDEAWRLLLIDANNGGGLDLVVAHGMIDSKTRAERWSYDAHIDHGGTYVYDAAISARLSVSGRAPGP